MERLVDPHQFPNGMVCHHGIQIRHGVAVQQCFPFVAAGKGLRQFREFFITGRCIPVFLRGPQQQHTGGLKPQIHNPGISGGRRHFSIEIVHIISMAVYVKIGQLPPFQQPYLILLSVPLKKSNGIVYIQPLAL